MFKGSPRHPKVWSDICSNDLEPVFWELVRQQLGYSDAQPNLPDLLIRILVTDFCRSQLGDVYSRHGSGQNAGRFAGRAAGRCAHGLHSSVSSVPESASVHATPAHHGATQGNFVQSIAIQPGFRSHGSRRDSTDENVLPLQST